MEGRILDNLIERYPMLEVCRQSINDAAGKIMACYEDGGKLLLCGNGGSGADCDHIAGELMKGFLKKRPLSDGTKSAFSALGCECIADKLQLGLPAVNLCAHSALIGAVANDLGESLVYAQQVMALGKQGDVLLGISTSGNAENILNAMAASKVLGVKTIGLTGRTGGKMGSFAETCICVPAGTTPEIQELHLPVYHAICAMVEAHFFEV